MKRIALTTLGCKTNQFESEAILDQFIKNGFSLVPLEENPDVVIINTCCVTNRAEYKSRYAIRKALELVCSKGKVVVTGCYVNKGSSFLEKIKNRIELFKNDQKQNICDILLERLQHQVSDFINMTTDTYHLHTRAPVKVQDGCNFFCSYCILPYVRGEPQSRSRDSIIEQVENLAKNGVKEIILTGINLGLYGEDLSHYTLLNLLQDLLRTEIKQIRLSSLEPMFFTEELINFFASHDRICPHFHIPLQSGSNAILKAMNRTYSTKDFSNIIQRIKEEIPNAAIGCDVIVGFPGESEDEFIKTRRYIEELPIAYLHVFRYSPRECTKGAEMKIGICGSVSKKRMQILQTLGLKKKNEYMNFLITHRISLRAVLETHHNGLWNSVSNHYIKVYYRDETARNGMLKELVGYKKIQSSNGIIAKEIQR